MSLDVFIPTIWSTDVLVALENIHVYASLCNRDYSGQIANMGDTVKITGIGEITVSDYTKDTDISAPQALTDAQTTLTIEKAKYFNIALDDVDARQAAAKNILDVAAERAAYDVADLIDQYVAGFYVNVAAANTLGSSSAWITPNFGTTAHAGDGTTVYDYLVQLNQLLTQSKLPKTGRYAVVPPWCSTLLMTDTRFTSYNTEAARLSLLTGKLDASAGALVDGFIGRINGMDVYESNNAPHLGGTTGITGSQDVVFGGHVMGMTYADNLAKVEMYRPPYRFADAIKGLHLYGAKIVRPQAMVAAYFQHP